MSYDVQNYVFKGVPISEFVATLSEDPSANLMCLASEDNPKKFLVVDDALVASLNETKKSLDYAIDGSPIEASKIAKSVVREGSGISANGPNSLLLHTIFRACGIAVGDHISADSELGFKFLLSFANLGNLRAYPLVEINGETHSMGVFEMPNELEAFVSIASKTENWNLIEDPRLDPESCEVSDPAILLDLKSNIEWALESPFSEQDMWREDYCAMLINLFIKPYEEFVEEDDCWTGDVGVVSTSYGDVHQYGGMEYGELYLIVSGDSMSGYDEDGWSDPEKETPTAYRKLKETLFDDPDYPTNKYTPQFGG